MAPIVLTALNAARPALPVIASGLATGARIVGFGAAVGAAYGVGFWSFGRTLKALNRLDGHRPRSTKEAANNILHGNADNMVAAMRDVPAEPLTQGGPANQTGPLPQAA